MRYRIQTALAFVRAHLHTPLTVPQLAEAAHLSPRQFSRAFRAETGQSPAKAIESLRVEATRSLMEQNSHPIDVVARQTGSVIGTKCVALFCVHSDNLHRC